MECDVMKLETAKSALKTATIVTAIIVGVSGFIGGVTFLVDRDRRLDERALCAPLKLDHSFVSHNSTHGVCVKEDGTLFLSEKTR
jgi:hypothetical protein